MSGKFRVSGLYDDWKKGDLLGKQELTIVLNQYSTLDNGDIALTEQLATEGEIDTAIDRLIDDLKSVKNEAKQNLKKVNARIKNSI